MSTLIMSKCWPLQMPPTAKSVLISLADNANDHGVCWPSIATIAMRTCFSERAVQNAIKWLESASLLRADRSNGRHTSYVVTPEKYQTTPAGDAPPPPQEMRPAPYAPLREMRHTPAGDAPPPPQEMRQPPQEVPTNRKEPSIEPSGNRQSSKAGFYPNEFEDTWVEYPKRSGANKKAAYLAWNARIKAGATAEEILVGVIAYAKYVKLKKTEDQFIKQAETFFGPKEHYKSDWTVYGAKPASVQEHNDRVLREFMGDDFFDDGKTIDMEQ